METISYSQFKQYIVEGNVGKLTIGPETINGTLKGDMDGFETNKGDIEEAYRRAIEQAQFEIIVANAYFFPGLNFRHALVDAAERGVRGLLMLQGRTDHRLLHYASHALYGSFLDAGIEIHEYQIGICNENLPGYKIGSVHRFHNQLYRNAAWYSIHENKKESVQRPIPIPH